MTLIEGHTHRAGSGCVTVCPAGMAACNARGRAWPCPLSLSAGRDHPPGGELAVRGSIPGCLWTQLPSLKPGQQCHVPTWAASQGHAALDLVTQGGGRWLCGLPQGSSSQRSGPAVPLVSLLLKGLGTLIGSPLLERGLDPFGECCRGISPSACPQRSQGWCWHGGLEMSYSRSN